MKIINIVGVSILGITLFSCSIVTNGATNKKSSATSALGKIINTVENKGLIDALSSFIGSSKPTEAQLYGSWHYTKPGVAFTSKNTLAKAGGEIAASQAISKLKGYYQSAGITTNNTAIKLNSNKTFEIEIAGKSFGGTYTYHPEDCRLDLKTFLVTIPCYVNKTHHGMSFLMESKTLLTIFQMVAAISGNNTIKMIGNISKNYDGWNKE